MLKIHTDGGARGNPGPAASTFVVYDHLGEVIFSQGKYLGQATNNQAEYQAVEMAIDWLIKTKINEEVEFYLDSLLVINQLQGNFKIKNPELKTIWEKIKTNILENKLMVKSFVYVPRAKNFLADSLVNKILDQYYSA